MNLNVLSLTCHIFHAPLVTSCGSTLKICQDVLKRANLLPKLGFVDSQLSTIVAASFNTKVRCIFWQIDNVTHIQQIVCNKLPITQLFLTLVADIITKNIKGSSEF